MTVRTQQAAGTPSWYDLTTAKPEETRRFYSHLFGWTFEDQGPDYGHYHMVRQYGHPVAGFMEKGPETAQMPSVWTVYYSSDDAQADAERIRELGGQIMVEPMQVGPLGHMLVAADPTGAVFGLWQPLEFQGSELENEHGSMTWQEVNTRDAERARDFYTRLFGATSEPMPGVEGLTYHTLKKGTQEVGGIMQMDEEHWPASIPPHWMPYFAVNEVQDAVRVAAENGGTVTVPPFDSPYGTIAVLTDPDGAVFSVIQLRD
ncbi:VOC family protein [Deinococcus apachensis]|uniref:VOC family protein n=1 Tax=Deinococcus apachensis TaxID=309886 RepID=UPI000374E76F|nr:VOC family protein [Deinococcus apachensis]